MRITHCQIKKRMIRRIRRKEEELGLLIQEINEDKLKSLMEKSGHLDFHPRPINLD